MIKGSRNLKFRTRTYVLKPCLRMTFTESPGGCRKPENNKIQFLFKISSEKLVSNFGISNNEQSVLNLEWTRHKLLRCVNQCSEDASHESRAHYPLYSWIMNQRQLWKYIGILCLLLHLFYLAHWLNVFPFLPWYTSQVTGHPLVYNNLLDPDSRNWVSVEY